jgi:hypothetical protein
MMRNVIRKAKKKENPKARTKMAHLQSSVGDYPKILHLFGAVIALVQIHVQRPGIQDVLLAFPAVEGLALRPY